MPHLDLIAYSQVGHTNFCYKYCSLMIDIAHGKVGRLGGFLGRGLRSSKANGLPIVEPEGREEAEWRGGGCFGRTDDVWS